MKVSVITVCYNAVQGIEKTIMSVLEQTYSDIEYIVIDGGSVDGTLDVIRKYKDKVSYYVSEPDNGIYDAMNKGVRTATGEWITFLNAGDHYYSNTSVEDVFSHEILPDTDVVYGFQVHSYDYGKFVRKRLPLTFFNSGMPFGHESSFVRSGVMKRIGFDTSYRIAADYNFFYKLYVSGNKFQPMDAIVTDFESMEGVSSSAKTTLLTHRETSLVNGTYASAQYIKRVLGLYIRILMKRLLAVFSKQIVTRRQRIQREHNDEYIPLNVFLSNHHA